MRLAVLLVLAACNQVFDLQPSIKSAEEYFDAHIDAPFQCPPLGTAPEFVQDLHQFGVQQSMSEYTVTTSGRAVAMCSPLDSPAVCEGPLGEQLVPARGVLPPSFAGTWYRGRLSQDGQRLYVQDTTTITLYRRNADDSWTKAAPLPVGMPAGVRTFGPPAASATGDRLLVQTQAASPGWEEWTDEGGAWHLLQVHPSATIGIPNMLSISMNADGLRAVAYSYNPRQVYYTDRAALDQTFRAATPLAGVPRSPDIYLSADCARIYTTGLGTIFYVQQR